MSDDIPSTASDWVARMNAGPLSSELQTAFDAWIARDPQNQANLTMVRLTWSIAQKLHTSDEAHKELRALKSGSEGTNWFSRLLGGEINPFAIPLPRLVPALAAVVLMVVGGVWYFEIPAPTPSTGLALLHNGENALTAIGEITSYELPDGSKLTVNADSNVRVAFTDERRQIFLESGQAFFEVQHNAKRPFVVVAGARTIVVTGTQFDVEYDAHKSATQVAVVAGHVNVGDSSHSADANEFLALEANDVFNFPQGGPPMRVAMAANLVSAWQHRKLYFEGTTIGDVLVSANRYTRKRLELTDPKLADLPLSGSFKAGDTDAILFSLETLYGIHAVDSGSVFMLSKSK